MFLYSGGKYYFTVVSSRLFNYLPCIFQNVLNDHSISKLFYVFKKKKLPQTTSGLQNTGLFLTYATCGFGAHSDSPPNSTLEISCGSFCIFFRVPDWGQ